MFSESVPWLAIVWLILGVGLVTGWALTRPVDHGDDCPVCRQRHG